MRRPFDSDTTVPSGGPALASFAPPVYPWPSAAGGAYAAGSLPGGSSPARGVPTFFGLINALKRRWVLGCFLGLLAGLAAAAGLWLGMPEGKHQVKGLLEVMPTTISIGNTEKVENDEAFKRNQEVLIRTRTLLSQLCERPRVAPLPMIAGSDDAPRLVDDMIKINWPTPDVMQVSLNGNNPDQMRIILDELMKLYVQEMSARVSKDRESEKAGLEQQKNEIAKRIKIMEDVQTTIAGQGVPGSPQERSEMHRGLNEQLSQIRQLQTQSKAKLQDLTHLSTRAAERLKVVDTDKVSDTKIDAVLSGDPTVQKLSAQVEEVTKALESAKSKAVDKSNPLVVRLQKQLDGLSDELAATRQRNRADAERRLRAAEKLELELAIDNYKQEIARLDAIFKSDQSTIDAVKEQLDELSKRGRLLAGGMRELELMQDNQHAVTRKLLELTNAPRAESRVQIRETPQISLNHNLKQKMVFSSAVAIGAFVGVLALVGFLEWRNRRVDGVEQVVNELGLRVIGTIPAFPSRASIKAGEADANQNWRFILNESVNSTRTMLLHSAKSQSMQVIMVTSAMQGEGKTSLASQLATSMATAGLRTLILDFDLRNPSMHRLFDINLSPGASEVVLQELDVSDAVQPTTVPNLWLIPAGLCSNRVVAALAQGHPLETLFNRLRGQFDFIVVDTCPILPVADALLIGQHVDGAVISILQDISQLPKVMNASERLTQLNIPLIGAVVNGIRTDIHSYGYNYVKQLPA